MIVVRVMINQKQLTVSLKLYRKSLPKLKPLKKKEVQDVVLIVMLS